MKTDICCIAENVQVGLAPAVRCTTKERPLWAVNAGVGKSAVGLFDVSELRAAQNVCVDQLSENWLAKCVTVTVSTTINTIPPQNSRNPISAGFKLRDWKK